MDNFELAIASTSMSRGPCLLAHTRLRYLKLLLLLRFKLDTVEALTSIVISKWRIATDSVAIRHFEKYQWQYAILKLQ
jgi:hypothetical protein